MKKTSKQSLGQRIFPLFVVILYVFIFTFNSFAAVNTGIDLTDKMEQNIKKYKDKEHKKLWDKIMGIEISWPDAAFEPGSEPVPEDKRLNEGDEFQIIVNAPEKIVCGNHVIRLEQFSVTKSVQYYGKSEIEVLDKNYDKAMKAAVFNIKVNKVDEENPHYIACVNIDYEWENKNKSELEGTKEMALGMNTMYYASFAGTTITSTNSTSEEAISGKDLRLTGESDSLNGENSPVKPLSIGSEDSDENNSDSNEEENNDIMKEIYDLLKGIEGFI